MFNGSLIPLLWLFIVYAFFGWCLEVIYATVHTGKFVNRGFLNGPYCPIYGIGMIIVLALLEPFKVNIPIFFVGSVILTTVLEFLTGYILEKIFNQKWWDYSGEPFNLWGYVCLGQSLVWGVGCIFVIYILQPFVRDFIHIMSSGFGFAALAIVVFVFVVDIVITVASLLKVKKYSQILDDFGDRIKLLSDSVGKNISDSTISAMKLGGRNKQELDNLREKYQAVIDKNIFGYKRLVKAFPNLRPIKNKKIKKQ